MARNNDITQQLARRLLRGKNGIFVVIIGIIIAVFSQFTAQNTSQSADGGQRIVKRCVDGDTLLLEPDERIRLVGADTPETVKPNSPVEFYGPEASAFTKLTVESAGNRIRLEFDGDTKDKFERTLAFVYINTPNGEIMLNEELIRLGYARAQTQYKYSQAMKDRFSRAEAEAKAAKRGIWSGGYDKK